MSMQPNVLVSSDGAAAQSSEPHFCLLCFSGILRVLLSCETFLKTNVAKLRVVGTLCLLSFEHRGQA